MRLNVLPSPLDCANVPGGVNSVVSDHAAGFLAQGHEIAENEADINIVHAIAQHKDIDVFHCHGLYPIGPNHFDSSYSKANNIVLSNALKAKVTICISEFSANILRHKLHIDPIVTRNGIWVRDYKRGGTQSGPILFPKAALDANAKADDIIWLRQNTKLDLLSIAKINGVRSTGRLSRQKFLRVLGECSIYLGTTKENNSMATMEALIMGVPVVGYNFGFNAEWLISGNGCELVAPGDKQALKQAIEKVKGNWRAYSDQARKFAEIFDWQPVIKEITGIYERVLKSDDRPAVSIVIPCYNYERFVGDAIESAIKQTVKCEIIVVDDCSKDHSYSIACKYPVTVLRNKENLGVAETRNVGIRAAKGNLIVCLDADDRLSPEFVEQHIKGFETNDIAVTFAPIALVDEAGNPRRQSIFKAEARPEQQAQGKNQIPSCCMFRKVFWARAGGYEKTFTPAEDAHLWLKIFQLGGQARKVSSNTLMDYRVHGNSLSSRGFPDWWKGNQIDFHSAIQERDPEITIVIDKQDKETQATLWSLENQDYQKWACLLQEPSNLKQAFPWLNHNPSRKGSVIKIRSGTILPANYLSEYVKRIPEWIMPAKESPPLLP